MMPVMIAERMGPSSEGQWEAHRAELPSVGPELLPLYPNQPDYQTALLEESFDWDRYFEKVAEAKGFGLGRWYFVAAFYSALKPDADEAWLHSHDAEALAEARQTGDLISYLTGEKDKDSNCVSVCVWTGATEAFAGSQGPGHRKAKEIASLVYEQYKLDVRMVYTPVDGSSPVFTPFDIELFRQGAYSN
jgi:hypothetical protein